MRRSLQVALLLALVPIAPALAGTAGPLAHTYSIVARDPQTGDFGVAVQSHWFAVGTSVAWAEPGVGAVATQSFIETSFGPRGLALLRRGRSAQQVLDALLAADPERDVRQVAIVDREGRVATWTGKRCIEAAGHQQGKGFSVQANMMDRATVWPAMARAFEASAGEPLAERLLRALEAAEGEGGDVRGRQSAAIKVVRGKSAGKPWAETIVDLRVDDHDQPVGELRRLYRLQLAYDAMNAGDAALARQKVDEALAHYTTAAGLAPQVQELPFWQAVTLFTTGRQDQALEIFGRVFAADPKLAKLVPRLPKAGLLPDDPEAIRRILAKAPPAR